MKIVHICLNGIVTDGWNYQDNVLPKYQKLAGNDVCVITSRWVYNDKGQLELTDQYDYVNADGVRVIRLKQKGQENFGKKIKRYEALSETIASVCPDVLFIHGVSSVENATIVSYLKKHRNVVAFADNHSDLTNSGTNWVSKNILHKIIWRHYARKLVPYVKKFYGVLPVRVDFLKDIYKLPADKCELLVMGADDELVEAASAESVRNEIREKYGIASDDFLIVTGGKIDKWKTQTLLLMEAVRKIDNPKVKLIVFGSISPELKEAVQKLTDGERVQYIGWIEAKNSYYYFASADLVVFPGRHSVFWEQVVAQGVPMMCKDLPGTHHVDLGGNVRFIKEDSADVIRNELQQIIDDPSEYEKMKKIAVEKGMSYFSYREIARKSIEGYDEK